jgi:hypothetical protein
VCLCVCLCVCLWMMNDEWPLIGWFSSHTMMNDAHWTKRHVASCRVVPEDQEARRLLSRRTWRCKLWPIFGWHRNNDEPTNKYHCRVGVVDFWLHNMMKSSKLFARECYWRKIRRSCRRRRRMILRGLQVDWREIAKDKRHSRSSWHRCVW